MEHLQTFQSRSVQALPIVNTNGWCLKRYAILSKDHDFDDKIASAALQAVSERLPTAGDIFDASTNHGVGFQIVHFAEVAVVAPAFYWKWGSVLANVEQIRAPWEQPTIFAPSNNEVVGCVWEMDIVNFEVTAWKNTILGNSGTPNKKITKYLLKQYST
ncbi:hypothetical protein C1J03_10795 [Sulfitobacter sp. SK012]|uniref:hypothetical protein n=1 Tax=Sulfitobacter sp. SK012 TaxID=1389005 RepID=UPI000E0BFD40|nr:hypothetical protein [Sulfitobacter sp. SK012]AXI46465.1 hypothetical protein C1J03_10795 [Sulfitobacter sp. SK012]